MKSNIDLVGEVAQKYETSLSGLLGFFRLYLEGVYHQGTGDFDSALRIFQDDVFNVPATKGSNTTSSDELSRDIALLALLNTVNILQDSERLDLNNNASLLERLESLCLHHPNKDIVTAFHLIKATVKANPPIPMFQIKQSLKVALSWATATSNSLFLCITLSVMCSRFFSGVVGDQALKSALSASKQSSNSGNPLWTSVADGMLAQCYDVHGRKAEAQATLNQALQSAQKAFPEF